MLKFAEDKTSIAYKIRELIYQAVQAVIKESDIKIGFDDIVLEHPENEKHGDYSSNIALTMFSQIRKKHLRGVPCRLRRQFLHLGGGKGVRSPAVLAQLITKNIPKADYLEAVEVAGSGFLNFWLSREYFFEVLSDCLKLREKFGKSQIGRGKKVIVEFAHPNTHKPFHLGHLRNICLGESISRLLGALGVKVIRANYQGDVGLHIAKCLWAIQNPQTPQKPQIPQFQTLDEKIDFLGKAYATGNRAYEEEEKAKAEIIKINHQIYQKDPVVLGLWQETRQWSLDYFERIYQRLNTKFDRLYFESECLEGVKIAREALRRGILTKSKGAIVFAGEKYGLDTRVFITADGLPTYEGKELKLAQMEFSEHGELDQVIHVVGPEQQSFFKVTFKVEELLEPKKYKDKQYHRVYGWVRLKKGKMSSRAGEVVTAEWLLDEARERIKKLMAKVVKSKADKEDERVTERLAQSAVKYSMLKLNAEKELVFDIDESINLQGDSGPYLQYTYARCQSVLRKASQGDTSEVTRPARLAGGRGSSDGGGIGERGEVTKEELAILRTLYKFPEVVFEAGKGQAPNLACSYLYDLATKFNTFYNRHRILQPNKGPENPDVSSGHGAGTSDGVGATKGTPRQFPHPQGEICRHPGGVPCRGGGIGGWEDLQNFRLVLTAGVGQVLKNGLNLLGIEALKEM